MVNTKMTAIADKIRSLLGITEKMGLDAMATNLGTEQTNIQNAFTAVGNKGGTVPSSKVSGNLVNAIASIPEGGTVQKKTGTFTTDKNGSDVSVSCGFVPDIVIIKQPNKYTESGKEYVNDMCANLTDTTSTKKAALYSIYGELYSTYKFVFGYIWKTTNGFKVNYFADQSLNGDYSYISRTFNYTAIKYT